MKSYAPRIKFSKRSCCGPRNGFSLVELLVVMAVTATLAVVLLPPWVTSNRQGQGAKCMSDMRQLTAAWMEYTSDNRGKFVPNADESDQPGGPTDPGLLPGGIYAQWCPGRQDVSSDLSPINLPATAANIGYEYIEAGLIYPYVHNVHVYLCPADTSSGRFFGLKYPHVRSRSMNEWLNPKGPLPSFGTEPAAVYVKESDLVQPGPSQVFVFIDENPASINDGSFVSQPGYADWVDGPASYHNGGAGLSFADGHAEIKRWTDQAVLTALTAWPSPVAPQQNPPADLTFLENASSYVQ